VNLLPLRDNIKSLERLRSRPESKETVAELIDHAMLTSPSFESEISFNGSSPVESLSDGANVESIIDQWGVVSESNYGSEVNEGSGSEGSGGYVRPGYLILEGESSSGNETTNLSIPGTFSLPTEIDTLSVLDHDAEANDGRTLTLRKRSLLICSLSMAALFTTTLGFLLWERRSLQSSTVKLGHDIERLERENAWKLQEEIQRLEQEKQDIKDSCSSRPIWEDTPGENQSDDFTIIDNCWLKAQVQFGPCSDETKSSFNEFKTNAWKELRDLFTGTSSFDEASYLATMAGLGQGSPTNDNEKTRSSAFPGFESFGAAGKRFTSQTMGDGDSDSSTKFDFEEAKASLTQASQVVSEAVLTVTEAMASGIKDLSNDPVAHLAAALKSASRAAEKDPITMNGIAGAGKAFSSASAAMGKVVTETGDIISVKVSAMMEDPLSFFEFETERK
jgi:hypothetical protein